MRHNLCLTLLSVLLIFFTFACDKNGQTPGKQQSLEDAIELTKSEWNKYDYAIAWDEPIPANTQIDIVLGGGKENEVSPEYETWLIVADTNPLANGGPHYKWIFVSTQTGQISTLMTTSEPFPTHEDFAKHVGVIKEWKIIEPQIAIATPGQKPRQTTRANHSANNCWAIILSGGAYTMINFVRYWNDCSLVYKVFTQTYEIPKDHILTLISDGTDPAIDMYLGNNLYASSPTDLDGDGLPDIQYSATKSNLANAFSQLATNVQPGDNVVVYVIDHGDHDGTSSYICLWNNQRLYPHELASLAAQITPDARIHFVLGQCKSGGFISALSGNNRTITTACREDEYSNGTTNGDYDEFVYLWAKAIGDDINHSDENQDGKCSLHEAFTYANEKDRFRNPYVIYPEHPQYNSIPSTLGSHYDIVGNYAYIPRIIGNSDISSNSDTTYSIEDLPEGAIVDWRLSINNQVLSIGTGDSIHLSNCYSTLPYQPATIRITITNVGNYKDRKPIALWKAGIHLNNDLIYDYGNGPSGEFALWCNPAGAKNFVWETNDPEIQIRQEGFFATYEIYDNHEPNGLQVWVSFDNPLGERTTVVRTVFDSNK